MGVQTLQTLKRFRCSCVKSTFNRTTSPRQPMADRRTDVCVCVCVANCDDKLLSLPDQGWTEKPSTSPIAPSLVATSAYVVQFAVNYETGGYPGGPPSIVVVAAAV